MKIFLAQALLLYTQLAYAYLYAIPSKRDFELSEMSARKAIQLDPEYGPAVAALAQDWKGAVEDYTRAIDLSPTSSYYRNRAKAYEALGEPNLAKKDREEAERSVF